MARTINGRYFQNTPLCGNVQGYAHAPGETGVSLSWCVSRDDDVSYATGSLYLSPADAREIARVLIEAADYSEAPTEVEKIMEDAT